MILSFELDFFLWILGFALDWFFSWILFFLILFVALERRLICLNIVIDFKEFVVIG